MIRWITQTLGTAAHDEARALVQEGRLDITILDVRDLVDREGNASALVRQKIDEGLALLVRGERPLVVCCDYGMSRSNSIAAGVLSLQEKIPLSRAVRRVLDATGETAVRVEVLGVVRRALGEEPAQASRPSGGRRSVLITGASGFVGATVAQALSGHFNVHTPGRQDADLARDAAALDLIAKESGADTLVHLANPRVYSTNEALGASLVMLKNALDVCAENGLRLVFASSWEVFSGYRSAELVADEVTVPRPGGSYGQSKVLCETLIEHYRQARGLRCTLLRSSPVYGPGSDKPKFIYNFWGKARAGMPIVTHVYRNGPPKLDLLHVQDLCRAIVMAIEKQPDGIIHLGTGIGTSTADIARLLVGWSASSSEVRHHAIDGYASNVIMNISRAEQVLDWRPSLPLAEGLQQHLASLTA